MAGKFTVQTRENRGSTTYLVVNREDESRPVAEFDEREAADAHAEKLNQGPLDLDEQEQWKDEWDDEDDW